MSPHDHVRNFINGAVLALWEYGNHVWVNLSPESQWVAKALVVVLVLEKFFGR